MSDSTYPDLAKVEDWLNAKGYTGEAGACHAAMDKIREQARRIAELEEDCEMRRAVNFGQSQTIDGYVARIAELEAALKPFADCGVWDGYKDEEVFKLGFKIADLRAARAALGEKE